MLADLVVQAHTAMRTTKIERDLTADSVILDETRLSPRPPGEKQTTKADLLNRGAEDRASGRLPVQEGTNPMLEFQVETVGRRSATSSDRNCIHRVETTIQ